MASTDRKPVLKKCMSETATGSGITLEQERQREILQEEIAEGAATLNPNQLLWDWPFNNNGYAKCNVEGEKFSVNLDFSYLKNVRRNTDVRKLDGIKQTNYAWQIGLSSITDENGVQIPIDNCSFWKLEMKVISSLNMVIIEASRQVGGGMSVRTMRTLRRVFKLPQEFDADTLQASITDHASFLIEADRRQEQDLDSIVTARRAGCNVMRRTESLRDFRRQNSRLKASE